MNSSSTPVPVTCTGHGTGTLAACSRTSNLRRAGRGQVRALPTTSTTYTVTGTKSGCTGTSSITVNVNTSPTVGISASANPICSGTSTTLTASGATTYSWSGGLGTTNPLTISPTTSTTYTVTGTKLGCTGTAGITVNVNSKPIAPVISQIGNQLNSNISTGNQWYYNGTIIVGATSLTYTPSLTGNYCCIVSDVHGCKSDTSNVIYIDITGLNVFSDNKDFNIYPNPANDHITLESGNFGFTNSNLRIYNVVGDLILEERLVNNKTSIDITTFSKGLYFIKVENENRIVLKKFVKD